VVDVQAVTKDTIRKKITHRSLVYAGKTSLKDRRIQSVPSLSPSPSRRSQLPPPCTEAGMTPLAVVQTLSAVADLERVLTLVPFTSFWIGLRETLDDGRLSPTIEEMLKKIASQLQT
jgi:hypothetical protein